MSYIKQLLGISLTVGILTGMAAGARAEDPITVISDQSKIIRLDRVPGTIVVGNPSIADVTMQGNQLFLHGRASGKTNIIVLDDAGNTMVEYAVHVLWQDDESVVVFKGSAATGLQQATYSCVTDCQPSLSIGDDQGQFKVVSEQQKMKIGLGQGQKSGETTGGGSPTGQAQ